MKRILWIDDEINMLKPHIMFLENRDYEVTPVVSGNDALEMLEKTPNAWDVILLDENMPGLSGLDTLERLKLVAPAIPVVMITKSEEENIMDQAVGNQIRDYLIKPVNPNQILLTLKRLLHSERLVTEQASVNYRKEFTDLTSMISSADTFAQWSDIYRRMVIRMREFNQTSTDIAELLRTQFNDAQRGFTRFIEKNYVRQFALPEPEFLLSHRVMEHSVIPLLREKLDTVLLIIDNFRLDQWMAVSHLFSEHYNIDRESTYCSLLPTATQYARNALISGLLPAQIEKQFPELWIDEDDERSKNLNEEPLVHHMLQAHNLQGNSVGYYKANNSLQLQKVIREFDFHRNLDVIVVNFIDIMAHSKTDSHMLQELASNDAAYVSLTYSWFRHSPLMELIARLASAGKQLIFTTDHGSIRVNRPVKVVGERETNTALRYKLGRNLGYSKKEVFEIDRPAHAGLPSPNISTAYIFARKHDFFVYPQNYNQFVKYYTDTYQHGGISFEEMILPLVKLTPRT